MLNREWRPAIGWTFQIQSCLHTFQIWRQKGIHISHKGSMSPLLYAFYTHDLPITNKTIIWTFADGIVIFATHDNAITASSNLQEHLILIEAWLNKWKIKVIQSESTQTTFTRRKGTCPPVQINHTNIQPKEQAKYLGLTFDNKLNWRQHIIKKTNGPQNQRTQLAHRERSHLSLENKLLIYKTVIEPIWTYGIKLRSCYSKSNIAIIQRAQSKILRSNSNAPQCVSNHTQHIDLKTPYVTEVIRENSINCFSKLENHSNPLLQPLLQPHENRRLKRNWPQDLGNWGKHQWMLTRSRQEECTINN
jgi:hypothetical protein